MTLNWSEAALITELSYAEHKEESQLLYYNQPFFLPCVSHSKDSILFHQWRILVLLDQIEQVTYKPLE